MDNTNSTQKNQVNQQNTLKYVRLPLEMLDLEWATSADVVVYAFMLNRHNFFKNIGKSYFENIDDISLGSRQSVATVGRAVKKLQENKFIEITKVKSKIGYSNSYTVNDVFNTIEPVVKQKKKHKFAEDLDEDMF